MIGLFICDMRSNLDISELNYELRIGKYNMRYHYQHTLQKYRSGLWFTRGCGVIVELVLMVSVAPV